MKILVVFSTESLLPGFFTFLYIGVPPYFVYTMRAFLLAGKFVITKSIATIGRETYTILRWT